MINGQVTNHTNRDMDSTKVILTQHIGFHATSKSRWEKREVTRLQKGKIPPGETESYNQQGLHIPPIPASYLGGCNIIDIQYILELVVDPSGPATDLEVPLPVIIGTIPLQNVFAAYAQGAYSTAYGVPSAPPAGDIENQDRPPLMPQGSVDGPPPPSYAQCVFGAVDIKDDEDNEYTKGDLNYAPVYPYYSWSQPTDYGQRT